MWAVILMREGISAEVLNCIPWNTDFFLLLLALDILCEGPHEKARPVCRWCRQDNNLPHDLSVEPSSRARMHYHNHLKSCLYFTMQNPEIILRGPNTDFQKYPKRHC